MLNHVHRTHTKKRIRPTYRVEVKRNQWNKFTEGEEKNTRTENEQSEKNDLYEKQNEKKYNKKPKKKRIEEKKKKKLAMVMSNCPMLLTH